MQKSTILINNIEIEKATINEFLIQNKKLEAIKFVCEKAHIDIASSKKIVELFHENPVDYFDNKDLYSEVRVMPEKDQIQRNPKSRKKFLIVGLILLFSFLFVKYIVGFNHLPYHLSNLKEYLFGTEDNDQQDNDAQIAIGNNGDNETDTAMVLSIDDLYPVDTNRCIQQVKEKEIEIIKNAHFEKLKVAKNPPSDESARIALIYFTNGRLTDVIINQKLNVTIGECYENPNTQGAYRCVSCMILLYNRDTKRWQEAPDGDNFLKPAYDFLETSKGGDWIAKDLSMRIPFDYKLFSRYK